MISSFNDWKAYQYFPSMGAAVLFTVLLAIVSLMHTFHLFRTRTWFFIPLVIGGYFEAVGYIGRIISAHQSPNWTTGPYIIQSTLLLVAPAFFAASIYMELRRIIVMVKGERLAPIRVKWTTKIFVAGDVLSFLMQASGAGIMVSGSSSPSGTNKSISTGQNVIIGGLLVQIIFFGFFLISAFVFQRRLALHSTAEGIAGYLPWRKHLYALYTSSLLVLVRSIVRVVEYIQGMDGYVMSHEAFIYVFDGMLMFALMVIFLVIHPSEVNCLLGRGRVMTTKGGLSISDASGVV